jgi:hypothetical protein
MATTSFSQEPRHLTSNESQQLMLDLLFTGEIIAQTMGKSLDLAKINNLKLDISNLPENQVLVFTNFETYEGIRSKLDAQITRTEDLALNLLNNKVTLIDDSGLALCRDVKARTVYEILQRKFLADEILAASKWECLQTALGVNTSELCTPLSITADIFDALYAGGEHCLLDQNEAVTTSIFGNIEGIDSDIIEYIDSKISDVTSQDQLDDTQDSTNDLNVSLNDNLPVFESNLTLTQSRLDQTNNQLNVIIAKAQSLLNRVQTNQIEIENLAINIADAQQEAIEIREDTQTLLTSAANLIIQIAAINQETQTKVKSAFTQQIEFALARPANASPLHFQLPLALGGQLELVREKLINNISTVESLGGKTAVARKLLLLGDQAFNSSQYSLAYNNYSDAYKALLEVSF